MRRALITTIGTTVGLAAVLSYKSGGAIGRSRVAVSAGQGALAPAATSPTTSPAPAPATTSPASTGPTTLPATGSPATSLPATSPQTSVVPSTTVPSTTTVPAQPAQYTGDDVQYRYGDIVVQITVAGNRITKITIPQESATDPRSQSINDQAIPILTSEALAAQNLQFDVVSGATYTSDAFAQSMQAALSKAGR